MSKLGFLLFAMLMYALPSRTIKLIYVVGMAHPTIRFKTIVLEKIV